MNCDIQKNCEMIDCRVMAYYDKGNIHYSSPVRVFLQKTILREENEADISILF